MKKYPIWLTLFIPSIALAQITTYPKQGGGAVDSVNGYVGTVVLNATDVGAQPSLGFTPENVANKDTDSTLAANSDTKYASQKATRTFALSMVGGLPSGVYLTQGNKIDYRMSKEGLLIQSHNLPAQTAGAYNGGGTGNKALIGFDNYDSMPFSSLTRIKFTARSVRDELGSTIQGSVYWNLLANFNTGATSLATDYVNLVLDGIDQHKSVDLKYYNISSSFTDYDFDSTKLSNERAWKAAGGTECSTNLINSGGTAVGSMTGLNNTSSIIVGQNIADNGNGEYNISQRFPSGTTVVSVDSPTQITMSANATSSGTEVVSFYGGVNPPNRTGTCNGTTTITIANTDDVQVNQIVTGTGVPANSYIVSKVRNVSITLNNSCTIGTPTLSFVAAGKTGIPSNASACGVTWAKIVANNPNGYFKNTAPTVAGGWLAADGGFPKNAVQSAFNFVQGSSSTLDARINALKSVTINSDTYLFTNQ